MNDSRVLRGVADIRQYFHENRTPIYFVSATNFNLMGIDEWVGAFKYINYIDCFDGHHPNVLVPREVPHSEFTSIEDINNYLLEHKEVVDHIERGARGADRGRAVFLMFDERTEAICRDLGLGVAFPPADLRRQVDDKISGTRIGERAGVKSVPNALGRVTGYASLRALGKDLGPDLVVQTAFGDSGHTTFFISSESDYAEHAAEIEREPEVKVMKRIRCRGSAIEGCVTRRGTLVGPLMTELVGFKELTAYRGGWCGNELFPNAFPEEVRRRAREATFSFGEELRRMGYRGYFELDFLTDLDSGSVYLGEINPRITGASSMTNMAAFAHGDAPLFLFHLLEWSDVDFELDVEALNERWSAPENIDSWSQMVIKHTTRDVDRITLAPPTGLWRMREGRVEYVKMKTHRRAVDSEAEAFFLRIAKAGDYRYEGADLGILLMRGRAMDENYQLTERARAWIAGIRSYYQGQPVASGQAAAAAGPPDYPTRMSQFKIL